MGDGKQGVRLDMTGEEFKRLIEQRNPNNTVDTLQEVLAMFEGISDGETIAEYFRRVVIEVPENSVGTEQIKDGSVMMNDLNEEVKNKMTSTYYDDDESLYLEGEKKREER